MASMHFSSRTHACSLLFAAGLRFAAVCVAQNLARWQTCFPHWRWLLWIGFGSGTTARAFPRTRDGVHFPKCSRKTFMKRTIHWLFCRTIEHFRRLQSMIPASCFSTPRGCGTLSLGLMCELWSGQSARTFYSACAPTTCRRSNVWSDSDEQNYMCI